MTINSQSIFALIVLLAICGAVAVLGARVTAPEIPGWYAALAKPPWTPPRLAFPIVWPILYVAMAIAAWLLWQAPASPARSFALAAFAVQLALNAAWSPVFFGRHDLLAGLVIIVLLAVAIAAMLVASASVSRVAALLLVPYLAWVVFAAALNARIWAMN